MMCFLLALACSRPPATVVAPPVAEVDPAPSSPALVEDPAVTAARETMVARQLERRDITDARVLSAMRAVPRHHFMPESSWPLAYQDGPAPIGHGQTISQPYIVAWMTQALAPRPGMKVLEVGTGSGYQAAVLSEVGTEVWSVEIVPELATWARGALIGADYPVAEAPIAEAPIAEAPTAEEHASRGTVRLRAGDGYRGWPAEEGGGAPYDGILVTAAPDHVPPALVDQLAEGGRLVIPVGPEGGIQSLTVLRRVDGEIQRQEVFPVAFVPMTGEARDR